MSSNLGDKNEAATEIGLEEKLLMALGAE